jgi:hypothetical protein
VLYARHDGRGGFKFRELGGRVHDYVVEILVNSTNCTYDYIRDYVASCVRDRSNEEKRGEGRI